MKFISLVSLIISLVSGKEEANIASKIIDGQRASSGKPWMVYLTNNKIACGGSLYTKSMVISAAHCNMGPANAWQAHLNRYNLGVRPEREGATVKRVLQAVNHPNWNEETLEYDVSVWWLDSDSDERTALKLDDGTEMRDTINPITIMGWGHTNRKTDTVDPSYGTPSQFLLEAQVPLVDSRKCMRRYHGQFQQDVMMCIGNDQSGSSTCQGDSGGPVFRKKGDDIVMAGIVSFGVGCGYKDFYGVNAKVSNPSITSFINSYVGKFTPNNKGNTGSRYPNHPGGDNGSGSLGKPVGTTILEELLKKPGGATILNDLLELILGIGRGRNPVPELPWSGSENGNGPSINRPPTRYPIGEVSPVLEIPSQEPITGNKPTDSFPSQIPTGEDNSSINIPGQYPPSENNPSLESPNQYPSGGEGSGSNFPGGDSPNSVIVVVTDSDGNNHELLVDDLGALGGLDGLTTILDSIFGGNGGRGNPGGLGGLDSIRGRRSGYYNSDYNNFPSFAIPVYENYYKSLSTSFHPQSDKFSYRIIEN